MVNLILKRRLSLKAIAFCLITKNILSVKGQEISDCSIVKEAANRLGESKVKFSSTNCCDLDVVTCNDKNVIGVKFIGNRCFDFDEDLEGAIDKLASLENLESFELSSLGYWCKYPKNFPKLKKLKTLIIKDNSEFSGTLPEDIIQLTNLETLEISNNRYSGSIPSSYAKLTKLKSLSLNNNLLTGYIPYSFSQLQNLTELNLKENQELKGYIPKMSKISTCDYGGTELCSLKSTTCTTNLNNICTLNDVTTSNKNNGNPNPNNKEYENDIKTASDNNDNSNTQNSTDKKDNKDDKSNNDKKDDNNNEKKKY